MCPYPVERFSDNFRVAQCRPELVRPRSEDRLSNLEGLGSMAFLDHVRKALLEVGFILEKRKMNGKGLGEGLHPVDRQRLNGAPGAKRPGIKRPRDAHKMRRLCFEMVAELFGIAELFVLEQTPSADVAK